MAQGEKENVYVCVANSVYLIKWVNSEAVWCWKKLKMLAVLTQHSSHIVSKI